LYDVGTITGSLLLGILTDFLWGKRIIVVLFSLLIAGVGHIFLIFLDETRPALLFTLIFFLGFLVGGTSNIICAPVCADIAKRAALKNESSIGTISGIVDGCGSFGASLG
jgi:sugar phosphate permease